MRRISGLRVALVATALAAPLACGFPSLEYATGGDAGADATSDGKAPDGNVADSTPPLDGAVDASTDATSDSSALPDAVEDDGGEDAAINCDHDKDGYRALTCDGGNDCCDLDDAAHPGLPPTVWFTKMPDGCGSWDYNCDGKVEEEFPVTLTCGGLGATGCTGGSGFMGDPGCGGTGPVYTCSPNGALACKAALTGSSPQGCR